MRSGVAFLGLLLACGCLPAAPQAPRVDFAVLQRQNVLAQIARMVEQPLARFDVAPDCASPDLQSAKMVARSNAEMTIGRQGEDAVLHAGALALRVADVARAHGCRDEAQEMYEFILAAGGDPALAPLRERARLGIADLQVAGTAAR